MLTDAQKWVLSRVTPDPKNWFQPGEYIDDYTIDAVMRLCVEPRGCDEGNPRDILVPHQQALKMVHPQFLVTSVNPDNLIVKAHYDLEFLSGCAANVTGHHHYHLDENGKIDTHHFYSGDGDKMFHCLDMAAAQAVE